MAKLKLPDADYLRKVLHYNQDTGSLLWKRRDLCPASGSRSDAYMTLRWNNDRAGKEAGRITPSGYIRLTLDGRFYYVHRLMWKMVHGTEPDGEIDHINGIRSDNRLRNLRVVTGSDNSKNRSLSRANSTGHVGVVAVRGKYRAEISLGVKKHYLGTFSTIEEAVIARRKAQARLGFTDRHGLPR